MGTGRTFAREFKVEAVKLVTDRGLSFTEAARKLRYHRRAAPEVGADPRSESRAGLPGTRQPHPGRGGVTPPAGRERAALGRAGHPKKATASFATDPP